MKVKEHLSSEKMQSMRENLIVAIDGKDLKHFFETLARFLLVKDDHKDFTSKNIKSHLFPPLLAVFKVHRNIRES